MPISEGTFALPDRKALSRSEKILRSRSALSNWATVGAASRAARWAERLHMPRQITRRILAMPLTVRPRDTGPMRIRIGDLGAVYDVFVARDYDFLAIDWRTVETVIDCGANVGAFTFWAASKSLSRIFAVEPSPNNYPFLERNAAKLSGRARTHRAAVAGQPGRVSFYESAHGTTSSLVPWRLGWDPEVEIVEVQAITLAEVFARSEFGRVDLLKLDIEGAEQGVFQGLEADLLARVRYVMVECHVRLGVDLDAVVRVLRESGLQVGVQPGTTPMVVASRAS